MGNKYRAVIKLPNNIEFMTNSGSEAKRVTKLLHGFKMDHSVFFKPKKKIEVQNVSSNVEVTDPTVKVMNKLKRIIKR